MISSIGVLLAALPSIVQVDSATVFRALWLGPVAATNILLLYMQVGYLEMYRAKMDGHLPVSWGEVIVRTLRGQLPTREDWYDLDWVGRQDIIALFAPDVCSELQARREQIVLLLVGMAAWFCLPGIAAVISSLAGG